MRDRFRSGLLALFFVASSSFVAAQAVGAPVTIAWDPNAEPNVIGYRVYVGLAPSAYSEAFDAGSATSFIYRSGVAGARYYFAVAAYGSGNVEGPRSLEVSAVIASTSAPTDGGSPPPGEGAETPPGDGGDTPPVVGGDTPPVDDGGTPPPDGEPAGIVLDPPTVSGQAVSFSWHPVGLSNLIAYQLEVGTSPGGTDTYNAPLGTQTSFSATVTGGSYYARVRARLPDDESVVSNEVGFSTGGTSCSAIPKTPRDVDAAIVAGVATIRWKQAARATSYIVQAGTGPGRSDLYNASVGAVRSIVAPLATTSPIYVRVIGVNGCGQSAASAEIRIQ